MDLALTVTTHLYTMWEKRLLKSKDIESCLQEYNLKTNLTEIQ